MKLKNFLIKKKNKKVNSVQWAPWEFGLKLAAGSVDGSISVISRRADDTWEKVQRFQAHNGSVNAVVWAPLINSESLSVII